MRRNIFISIALLLALAAGGAVANYLFFRPTALRLAVAHDTEDNKLAAAIARVFSATREQVRIRIVPVNSAAASAAALQTGAVDLAIVRSDIALPPNGQTIVILHHNPAFLIARGDSGVHGVADLKGKKVGIVRGVSSGSGNAALFNLILAQYDVAGASVEAIQLERSQVPNAIKTGAVDALFVVGALTSEHVADAVAATGLAPGGAVFVPITEAKAIAQRSGSVESTEIVRGAFGGNPPRPAEAFETVDVTTRLIARSSLRDSVAADLTRLLFSERLAIAQLAPHANEIEAPETEKGAVLPVHPGTAAYLDDEEKSFFDRYSDFIYIGAMLLSVVGSGLAAVASRMSAVSHSELDRLIERLLEILKAARAASGLEDLDQLEREADEILMTGVSNRRLTSVDAHGMAALVLALDQARQAIRERRVLVERPAARPIDLPRIVSGE